MFFNPFHGGYGWNHQDCEEILTAQDETNWEDRVNIYPNPATTSISIQAITFPAACKIRSIQGVIVQQGIISPSSEINIHCLPKGIYFLEIKGQEQSPAFKFIKS